MNKLIYIIFTILYSFNIGAAEKPSRADVIEYFEVTNTIKVLEGYSKSYITVLKEGYPNLDEKFYNDPEFKKALDTYNKNLLDECISIVINNLNKNDLNEISRFLKTELGKKLLKLNQVTDPLFNEAGTKANILLNSEVASLLGKYGGK